MKTETIISLLSFSLSLIAIFYTHKTYKIERKNDALNNVKLGADFALGIEKLRLIFNEVSMLSIKSIEDINLKNLNKDLPLLKNLLISINEKENILNTLFINISDVYEMKNYINEIIFQIETNDYHNQEVINIITRHYGFLYLKTYLLRPYGFPKTYIKTPYHKLKPLKEDFFKRYNTLIVSNKIS